MALLALVEAVQGFGLGVDEGQFRRELLEDGDGGRLVVDEDSSLPGGKNFAAEDDLGAFDVDAVFFEDGFGAGRRFKDARDDGAVGAVADDLSRRLAAHEQCEGIDEDGFARAGFAREQVEPRPEDGDGVVDDGVVFCAQFYEHFSLGLRTLSGRAETRPDPLLR